MPQSDKKELINRVKSGIVVTFVIYFVLSVLIMIFIKPMLMFMSANKEIISQSAVYIRLESIASIFSVLANFVLVVLVVLDKDKYVYLITGIRLFACISLDTFLVSSLPCSLNLGVNGIAVSNIIVNTLILIMSLYFILKSGIDIFSKTKLSFSWARQLFKIGGVSGLESFVRNIAYMLMIARMVNVINEQGTYWVANNFIWGWLLLPVTQLAEFIKKDVATDKKAIKNKSLGYFLITAIICVIWFVTLPLWKPFMSNILAFDDVDKLFRLVMILIGFYVVYAFQNVFDATFYGLGKTNYMLFETIVTNVVYYGSAFILYLTGIWIPTLAGIALLFGIGTAFDGFVSLCVYIFMLKKNKINILDID